MTWDEDEFAKLHVESGHMNERRRSYVGRLYRLLGALAAPENTRARIRYKSTLSFFESVTTPPSLVLTQKKTQTYAPREKKQSAPQKLPLRNTLTPLFHTRRPARAGDETTLQAEVRPHGARDPENTEYILFRNVRANAALRLLCRVVSRNAPFEETTLSGAHTRARARRATRRPFSREDDDFPCFFLRPSHASYCSGYGGRFRRRFAP